MPNFVFLAAGGSLKGKTPNKLENTFQEFAKQIQTKLNWNSNKDCSYFYNVLAIDDKNISVFTVLRIQHNRGKKYFITNIDIRFQFLPSYFYLFIFYC